MQRFVRLFLAYSAPKPCPGDSAGGPGCARGGLSAITPSADPDIRGGRRMPNGCKCQCRQSRLDGAEFAIGRAALNAASASSSAKELITKRVVPGIVTPSRFRVGLRKLVSGVSTFLGEIEDCVRVSIENQHGLPITSDLGKALPTSSLFADGRPSGSMTVNAGPLSSSRYSNATMHLSAATAPSPHRPMIRSKFGG